MVCVHGRYRRRVEDTILKAQESRQPAMHKNKFVEVCEAMLPPDIRLTGEAADLLRSAAEEMAVDYLRALQAASTGRGACEIKPPDVQTVRVALSTAARWRGILAA
ncbi:hypothetical protein AK812_SmicGene46936 [Symbiodinium microadriaticum]|uniref:Uncharacterized protein n=1 Tax=Symbiodinium microadriaticum TaxID=2951 RepID=A0A1Q9BSQ1_SYMMI|nr:hypothetical protein AK812_SmicGene46936 [Symbiodinium microadriaticum]CAE7906936.1 unnamed protein product [Symbiodinium microadriaticum]CAE7948965.1 unnamed protein product [Symbiodinium sp. KB8]